jgi:putative endonuclease
MLTGPKDSTDGARAETIAARHLERQGLRIEARNFRVRGGEVDLIARDGSTLVFVEVRLRRHAAFGGAAASITAAKRRRLVLAARHYLQRRPEQPCRFDCVLLDGLDERHLTWMRNAFAADD